MITKLITVLTERIRQRSNFRCRTQTNDAASRSVKTIKVKITTLLTTFSSQMVQGLSAFKIESC